MKSFQRHWEEYKSVWILIFSLFIVSRVVLLGVSSFALDNFPSANTQSWKGTLTTTHPTLHRMAQWDSYWYMKMATSGYSDAVPFDPNRYSTVGFFPLYPTFMFLVHFLVQDIFLSGLLVSNICFILAVFLLFVVVKREYEDTIARRAVGFAFLFPPAFIFSAVFPDSLLLLLWLGAVYYIQKGKWFKVGSLGFLAAMTKPYGFLILIPAFLQYLQYKGVTRHFLKDGSWKNIRPDILNLALIPAGLVLVAYIQYLATGIVSAYSQVQNGAWHHSISNPLSVLFEQLVTPYFVAQVNTLVVIVLLVCLAAGYRKMKFSYWLFMLCALLFIPLNGYNLSAWRYVAAFFPFFILFAVWGKNKVVYGAFVVLFMLLQAVFFSWWVLGYHVTV